MKALLHQRVSAAVASRITVECPPWLRVVCVDTSDSQRLDEELADADVLLHVLEPVTAGLLAGAPKLRLIQKLGVGINTIDLKAAARHAIRVCNMPGANSQAVAEGTLALMLGTVRKVVFLDGATRNGDGWSLAPGQTDDISEICGKTVGFAGYGAIPRRLAPVLAALGARLISYSRSMEPDGFSEPVGFSRLLAESDILSLHLPLSEQTRHCLNRDAIRAMKSGAILINTARGGLVDETALVEALRTGKLRGAGLDVFAQEPVIADNPLCRMPNVVLTPHTAWLTAETMDRCLQLAIDNCIRLRDGLPLMNEIELTAQLS